TIIANNQLLFRKQNILRNSVIRDEFFAFYLGAVTQIDLQIKHQLHAEKERLSELNKEFNQAEKLRQNTIQIGQSLLYEGQEVGLIDPAETDENIISIFEQTQDWQSSIAPTISNETLPILRDELYSLRQELRQNQEEISSVKSFIQASEGYSDAVTEQHLRLESINLFNNQGGLFDNACPLCYSPLGTQPPFFKMKDALQDLQQNLDTERRELPKLNEHLAYLQSKSDLIKSRIADKQQEIKTALASQVEHENLIQNILETNNQTQRVVAQIGLYLRMLKPISPSSELNQEIQETKERIAIYQDEFDKNDSEKRKERILNAIGSTMSDWANNRLDLEHKGSYKFDAKKLTVKVDKFSGERIEMERMGGRSNWLGCHLITLLALHKHFIDQNLPVPNFIILDQPAQVYYPNEESGDSQRKRTADMEAAERMFEFLFDVCESLEQNLQIIILEHANLLSNDRFQNSIIEVWQDGQALIPESWIPKELDEAVIK
ncbi:MAG: DUF3732 domain-containing protein, partial [Chloroflexota bacterium]